MLRAISCSQLLTPYWYQIKFFLFFLCCSLSKSLLLPTHSFLSCFMGSINSTCKVYTVRQPHGLKAVWSDLSICEQDTQKLVQACFCWLKCKMLVKVVIYACIFHLKNLHVFYLRQFMMKRFLSVVVVVVVVVQMVHKRNQVC